MVKVLRPCSKDIRRTLLDMVHDANAAHIGSALSCVDILNAVFRSVDIEKISQKTHDRARIILSKGHGAAALYATMVHYGLLSQDESRTYFKNGTLLAGHASHFVPHVEHSTGALGHGLSVALGIALGYKSRQISGRVYVVVGDGELHEGSNWEALMLAGHLRLNNLCVFIDDNRMSQIGATRNACTLEPLKGKIENFNFAVHDIPNGNDDAKIYEAIQSTERSEKPVAVICRTVKGKGVSFMENNNLWHYRAPLGNDYEKALSELNQT